MVIPLLKLLPLSIFMTEDDKWIESLFSVCSSIFTSLKYTISRYKNGQNYDKGSYALPVL